MSAFKDAVAKDVGSVFLNQDEFADWHDIGGERVKCLIDTDVTGEAKAELEGVFINALRIYVASCDLVRRPIEGEHLSVDGSLHFVRRVSDEMGVLVITCEANEQ